MKTIPFVLILGLVGALAVWVAQAQGKEFAPPPRSVLQVQGNRIEGTNQGSGRRFSRIERQDTGNCDFGMGIECQP